MSRWLELPSRFESVPERDIVAGNSTNELVFLQDEDGIPLVAKRFLSPRAYRREVAALTDLVERLAFPCPRLIEDLGEDESAIVMTWVPGVTPAPDQCDAALHRLAGKRLSSLHHLNAMDNDLASAQDALSMRFDDALFRAESWLSSEEREFVVTVANSIRELEPRHRVPCHGDFQPQNWLIGEDGQFGLVDFEQSRMNVPEFDFIKLHGDSWIQTPENRDAFFEGYGNDVGPGVDAWIQVLGVFYRLGTVNWMLGQGQSEEAATARAGLITT